MSLTLCFIDIAPIMPMIVGRVFKTREEEEENTITFRLKCIVIVINYA